MARGGGRPAGLEEEAQDRRQMSEWITSLEGVREGRRLCSIKRLKHELSRSVPGWLRLARVSGTFKRQPGETGPRCWRDFTPHPSPAMQQSMRDVQLMAASVFVNKIIRLMQE